ncbi:MAG: DEAD/DEAH box helicase family protein, partial [Spirochaetales bacterium]|nr:DEAD/DEAH box helicase family protein [Spirochaetales bacterium]
SITMGNLSRLNLKISYRSDSDNIINDFYNPCMSNSILYQRAVGYFTSFGLAYAATGIAYLISSSGKIRLIASPYLTDEDIAAIRKGYAERNDVIISNLKKEIHEITDLLIRERLEALSWLIAAGNMEVKLAIRYNQHNIKNGIYHEKIGIFTDKYNNHVAFSGSVNETASGLIGNFESIDVYISWDDPQDRVLNKIKVFEDLWNDNTKGLSVIDFTEATSDILKSCYPRNPDKYCNTFQNYDNNDAGMTKEPDFPAWLELRDYQDEAIKNWFHNNGQGCLKMATGSGKTIIALSIILHLYQKVGLKAVIIVCPFKHLVDQWDKEAKKFNFDPLIIHTSKNLWLNELNYRLSTIRTDAQLLVVIITNASFCQEQFQKKFQYFPPGKTLLIADEVHNIGAKKIRMMLPDEIKWRLGLSATPERWFDEEGTEKIFEYFGDVLKPEFTLKNAIDSGALVPYYYYPILVELTEEEQAEYFTLSDQIADIIITQGFDEDNEYLTHLLIKRARLIAGAENKLILLKDLMKDKNDTYHWLFYCGDSRVGYPTSETEIRQIEAVCKILGRELNMRVDKFVAETPGDERQRIIRKRKKSTGHQLRELKDNWMRYRIKC